LRPGEEKAGYADAGYLGVEKRAEITTRSPGVEWPVAAKRGRIKTMAEGVIKELTIELERLTAQVRARVEHPFHILKNLFRHRKTRSRGLAKNTAQLHSLFALANLVIARRSLLTTAGAWARAGNAANLPQSPPIKPFLRSAQHSLTSHSSTSAQNLPLNSSELTASTPTAL
jgi:transposase, IS5 family